MIAGSPVRMRGRHLAVLLLGLPAAWLLMQIARDLIYQWLNDDYRTPSRQVEHRVSAVLGHLPPTPGKAMPERLPRHVELRVRPGHHI